MATSTEFSLPATIAVLSRTPATLNALLRGCLTLGPARRRTHRRERYMERIRHPGTPDRRGAHRLDAPARIILQHGERGHSIPLTALRK